MQEVVGDAGAASPLDLATFSSIFGLYRSDYATFINSQIPSVFFTDSTGPCYHTVHDEFDVVDMSKLRKQVDVVEDVTRDLATRAETPIFTSGLPLATYDDLLTLHTLIERALIDRDRFPPAEQAEIDYTHQLVSAMVADGPDEFDNNDMIELLGRAAAIIDVLTYGECDGFLVD